MEAFLDGGYKHRQEVLLATAADAANTHEQFFIKSQYTCKAYQP
jgi:hypothetical protein